jgi:uncharacterized membrane protein
MTVNWSQLNKKAKALILAAIGAAASMQIPKVKDAVMPLLANHPKIASAFTSLIFIVGVIQNPVTKKILVQIGLEQDLQSADAPTPPQST